MCSVKWSPTILFPVADISMSPMMTSQRNAPVNMSLSSSLTLGLCTFIVCRCIELIQESKIRLERSLTVSKRWWSQNGSICSPCLNCSNSSLANQPIWTSKIWSESHLWSCEESNLFFRSFRSHVVYQGGYHRTHPVIKWLWQTLEQDFTREERALFLRVRHSPLLWNEREKSREFLSLVRHKFQSRTSAGIPFSESTIHHSLPREFRTRGTLLSLNDDCVPTRTFQEEGDSLGRIFRNMISINRTSSERLPSSSTCFNLLK